MPLVNAGTRIVVGVDGSDTSLGAAKWAAVVARKLGQPLHVVHSVPKPGRTSGHGEPSPSQQLIDSLDAEGVAVLASAVDAIREHTPDIRMTTELDSEPAAAALLTAAKGATMIVLGATGRGTVERWLLGSTAVRVVNQAPCPVVVWRGDPADPGPDTRPLVVGIDGSTISAAATELAFAFADLLGAPVTAVRSWTDEYAIGAATPEMLRQSGPAALLVDWEAVAHAEEQRLADVLAPFRDRFPGVTVNAVSSRGSAPRELLRALDDGQLAVVGSRGLGRVAAALLGSTSQNLLHRADNPVIVHREPDAS